MTRAISAAFSAWLVATGAAAQPVSRAPLTPPAHGPVLATIQGNALTAANAPLPEADVRLRDVRFGRMVAASVTDKAGLFVFRGVEPGNYIVELVGRQQTVLAASQIVNINGGETMSAVVKMPNRTPRLAGILGRTTPAALAVTAAAAASGVLASAITGEPASARK
jgi:hypothetical protein